MVIHSAFLTDFRVVFSFSEKAREGLYIAQTFFAPDGSMALLRRKLGLSESERKIFLSADGEYTGQICLTSAASLHTVAQAQDGLMMIGGLNSWEHLKTLL